MVEQSSRGPSPQVEQLQAEADAAYAQFAELAVVSSAESAVAYPRIEDLVEAQRKAWRRVSAARGQMTQAQRTDAPDTIRATREHLDARRAEADVISDAVINEIQQILEVRLESSGQLLDAARTAFDAWTAATDAVLGHRPGGQP